MTKVYVCSHCGARGGQLLKIYPDGDRVYKIYEHGHHQAVKS